MKPSGRHVLMKPENNQYTQPNVPKRPTFGLALRSSESVAVYFRLAKKKKKHAHAHGKRFSDGTRFVRVLCEGYGHYGTSQGDEFPRDNGRPNFGSISKSKFYVFSN